MKKVCKYLAMLMAVVCMMGLAACGKNSDKNSSNSGPEGNVNWGDQDWTDNY